MPGILLKLHISLVIGSIKTKEGELVKATSITLIPEQNSGWEDVLPVGEVESYVSHHPTPESAMLFEGYDDEVRRKNAIPSVCFGVSWCIWGGGSVLPSYSRTVYECSDGLCGVFGAVSG